ncbi:uncharacterized protein LOC113550193 [Rhopalosiphum maidis]|uniref:uncharacterized protein LOC113550193 n=1 Tax=Rhopalosiphum maidis TaxID=43146 RepID=UPI000F009F0E|nr:uncharacterized protein LOC113550193 [Rhopalosiphum maidis]
MKFNLYLSKKARNITEIKGNITSQAPLDDSLSIDYNLSSWSITRGWKSNSYVNRNPKACSTMKFVLGNAWNSFQKAFKIPSENCPLPSVMFTSTGLDIKFIGDNRAPKVYFYGKY